MRFPAKSDPLSRGLLARPSWLSQGNPAGQEAGSMTRTRLGLTLARTPLVLPLTRVMQRFFVCSEGVKSLFVVRCSLFVVRCSLFVVRCSVFGVRCSLFVVRCSVLGVGCWVFGVRRSVFVVGLGWVGLGWVGLGRVGSGRVGSGRVGSGRVGSGRVGSGRVGSGRVGSGRVGWVGCCWFCLLVGCGLCVVLCSLYKVNMNYHFRHIQQHSGEATGYQSGPSFGPHWSAIFRNFDIFKVNK